MYQSGWDVFPSSCRSLSPSRTGSGTPGPAEVTEPAEYSSGRLGGHRQVDVSGGAHGPGWWRGITPVGRLPCHFTGNGTVGNGQLAPVTPVRQWAELPGNQPQAKRFSKRWALFLFLLRAGRKGLVRQHLNSARAGCNIQRCWKAARNAGPGYGPCWKKAAGPKQKPGVQESAALGLAAYPEGSRDEKQSLLPRQTLRATGHTVHGSCGGADIPSARRQRSLPGWQARSSRSMKLPVPDETHFGQPMSR
jgi:hypothetical protein